MLRTRPDEEPDFTACNLRAILKAAKQFGFLLFVYLVKISTLKFYQRHFQNNPNFNPFVRKHRKIAQTNLPLCSQNSEALTPSFDGESLCLSFFDCFYHIVIFT